MIRPLPSGYNSGDTLYCYFPSYDSDGASVTITGLAVTDVEIYKNGSTTQRASDNGYALLDTDGIDFDGSTGLHGFTVDTSDNSDAGFYADGAHYLIWVDAITADGQTVRFGFELLLGRVLRSTTDGRKLDVSATGEAGLDLDNTSGTLDAAQLGADCITADKIADDAISAEHINTGALTADAFAANALVAATFAASSLDGKGDWNTVTPDAAGVVATALGDGTVVLAGTYDAAKTAAQAGDEMLADLTKIHGGELSESVHGYLANRFEDFFNQDSVGFSIATPLGSFKATGFSTHDAAAVKTAIEAGGSSIAQILADTGELQTDWANGGRLDLLLDAIPTTAMRGTDNAALASVCTEARLAELAAANLPADVDAIKVITDALTAAAAAKLALSAAGIVSGAAEAGTLSTTQMTTNLAEVTDDHYIGAVLIFTTGVLAGQRTDITDYAGATRLLSFTAITEAPSAADSFVIL